MPLKNGFASFVVFFFASFVVVFDAAAQAKKVYISVDMEGISGVIGDDQTSAGGAEYNRSRKLMAEDANAAIRGAFEGGAT
ncbi:MAG: M55 family metallopeptidase, partial [Acidobacteriota bacterium]|nr:M55 family metallopeptidase [Acidobacteriota bacterium]